MAISFLMLGEALGANSIDLKIWEERGLLEHGPGDRSGCGPERGVWFPGLTSAYKLSAFIKLVHQGFAPDRASELIKLLPARFPPYATYLLVARETDGFVAVGLVSEGALERKFYNASAAAQTFINIKNLCDEVKALLVELELIVRAG